MRRMTKMFEWLINLFRGRQPPSYFPRDWAVIEFTSHALNLGVKGDKNKIIRRFFINKFGKIEEKRYRYSPERVYALQEIHKVPVYDKTTVDIKFPIYSRVLPGEVQFISGR